MQYLGNGQYQIQNKSTGETRTVHGDDLASYGLQRDPSDNSQNNPIMGAVKNIAGLGAFGPIGQLASSQMPQQSSIPSVQGANFGDNITQAISPTARRIGEEANGAINRADTGNFSTPNMDQGAAPATALSALGPAGNILAGITGISDQQSKNLPAYAEQGIELGAKGLSEVAGKALNFVKKGPAYKAISNAVSKIPEELRMVSKPEVEQAITKTLQGSMDEGINPAVDAVNRPAVQTALDSAIKQIFGETTKSPIIRVGASQSVADPTLDVAKILSEKSASGIGWGPDSNIKDKAVQVLHSALNDVLQNHMADPSTLAEFASANKHYGDVAKFQRVAPKVGKALAKYLGLPALGIEGAKAVGLLR